MIRKTFMLIVAMHFLFMDHIYAVSLPKVDLFNMWKGKPVLDFENTDEMQGEVKYWLESITGIVNRENISIYQEGYCLRIPTAVIHLKNQWLDTSIQDVFLIVTPFYDPVLEIFDTRWPRRYLVHFSHNVRPFLQRLGIWETIRSFYSVPTNLPQGLPPEPYAKTQKRRRDGPVSLNR